VGCASRAGLSHAGVGEPHRAWGAEPRGTHAVERAGARAKMVQVMDRWVYHPR
jgi:hypothetical protein